MGIIARNKVIQLLVISCLWLDQASKASILHCGASWENQNFLVDMKWTYNFIILMGPLLTFIYTLCTECNYMSGSFLSFLDLSCQTVCLVDNSKHWLSTVQHSFYFYVSMNFNRDIDGRLECVIYYSKLFRGCSIAVASEGGLHDLNQIKRAALF